MRKTIVLVAGLALLALVNFTIVQREQLLTEGRVVLLELAPVDPRSLMQGDYMALNFKVTVESNSRARSAQVPTDGYVLLALDERGVASVRRLLDENDKAAPAANEVRMRFRVRNERLKFATNAFFFQEGHADRYTSARYGEFRVDTNGEAILVALRDANLKLLGGPPADARDAKRLPSGD